ncbi:ATP-binding protein [Sediminicoccus sp. KRV36]|uniref:ATP-binding protein n=1 Tax=Sediminicoccus sp. KRV36 TaxID=3133721 RepID=UPI00200EA5A7|nr:ATP-binding protein [Sediminicoccus rosea]UPY38725.1 response regulator [Sediminicoccus rosea]
MTVRAPGAEVVLSAWPHSAALLDVAGRVVLANAALRGALGGAVLIRPGDVAARLFPAAEAAIHAALGGAHPAPVLVEAVGLLRLVPLGASAGALLLLEPMAPGLGARLEILGRLAGGIAHDFNNLLSVVLGAAGTLRHGARDEAALLELEAIENAAQRGSALVRQLLAFARQQVMAPRVLDLNDSIRQLAGMLPRLLGARIEISLDLQEPARRIRVDPSQWDQVLMNLVVNARDAMKGVGVLRITTGRRLVLDSLALPAGRYAMVEVTDNGPGIPPEVLPRIFEPFFTTKLEQGGTGLGLATVQGIIGQLGGQMEVESKPGHGTTFRVLLPRHEGPAEVLPIPQPIPLATPVGPILLVDDEPSLLRVAGLCLQQAGFEVVSALDGEEALEQLQAGLRPCMIATDVAMPGMDGLALARAARAILPEVPILLLSGYAAAVVDSDLAAEGFRFLAKPYTPDALKMAVAGAFIPLAARFKKEH